MKSSSSPRLAVIYARSAATTQHYRSTDLQVQACLEHATKLGLQVARVYRDDGQSGGSPPALADLLDDARKGAFETVVVQDATRLNRRTSEMFLIIRTLDRAGVRIALVGRTEDQVQELATMALLGARA